MLAFAQRLDAIRTKVSKMQKAHWETRPHDGAGHDFLNRLDSRLANKFAKAWRSEIETFRNNQRG